MPASQPGDHAGEVWRLGEDVRPQAARAAGGQLEHRPVPEHRFALGPGQHEPGLAVLSRPRARAPASARSCAGGCAGPGRPRSSGAGSSRPPRPPRAGGRRAARPRAPWPRADAASRPRRARRPAPAAVAPRGGESLPRAFPGYASVAVILRALPMLVAVATATACGAQSSGGAGASGVDRRGGDLSGLAGLRLGNQLHETGEALPTRFLAKGRERVHDHGLARPLPRQARARPLLGSAPRTDATRDGSRVSSRAL